MSPKKSHSNAKPEKQKTKVSKSAPSPDAGGSKKKGSAARKIFALIAVVLLIAAAVFLLSKYKGCALFDNIKDYKDSYDNLSGSDYQEVGQDDQPFVSGDNKTEEHPQVDNSSDGSLLGMFTGCGGSGSDQDAADIDYDRFSSVTGTDAVEVVHWDAQESDEAYNSMMRDKTAEFITLFTQLEDMRSDLSECRNTNQVESNEKYIALRSKLLGWCSGAQSYSTAALGDSSQQASALAAEIAADTQRYLALYPTYVVSPDSVSEEAGELSSEIIDDMLRLTEIIS